VKAALIRFGPARRRTRVDNHKGASGLERGARSLRGEDSEGGQPKTVTARNKAVKLELAKNR